MIAAILDAERRTLLPSSCAPRKILRPVKAPDAPGAHTSNESSHGKLAHKLTETRNVLFIASRFPPVASVGAIRVRKFCKYLREFGWQPVVITGAIDAADDADAENARCARDESSSDDLPLDLPIFRLPAHVDHWPRAATRRFAERLSRITRTVGLDADRCYDGLAWRIEHLWRQLSFPDAGIWRLAAARRLAIDLHRRYRFSAIFSSGMPFSDHLIALAIQDAIRRPWIADFRDPWIDYVHWAQFNSCGGRLVARVCERAIVARADRVVSIGPRMNERFRSRYPARLRGKFRIIRNGFDPGDFAKSHTTTHARDRTPRHGDRFRLVYLGSLYGRRNPATLIHAFQKFLNAHPHAESAARLEFAGRTGPHAELISRACNGRTILHHGLLPHRAAIDLMADADALVVLQPDQPGTDIDVSAKIYEYLGANRAILAAIPNEGDAADLLRGFDGVWQAPLEDVESLAERIATIFRRWHDGTLRPERSEAALRPLTRRYQAGQLAALIDECRARRRRPAPEPDWR